MPWQMTFVSLLTRMLIADKVCRVPSSGKLAVPELRVPPRVSSVAVDGRQGAREALRVPTTLDAPRPSVSAWRAQGVEVGKIVRKAEHVSDDEWVPDPKCPHILDGL